MPNKTLAIDGPTTIFSTVKVQRFKAVCQGVWSQVEKQSLEWVVAFGDYAPVVLETNGETALVGIPDQRTGSALHVGVRLPAADIMAELSVVVVGMAVRPYAALASPIGDAQVRHRKTIRNGKERVRWELAIAGAKCALGLETAYRYENDPTRYLGIGMLAPSEGPRYDAAAFASRYGHWAHLLDATTAVEGGQSFVATNTYDRGRLSFGLIQFASHQPDANLVLLLRQWLQRGDAAVYFPEFELQDDGGVDRIHDRQGNRLESASSTAALCAALNPDPESAGATEARFLARLIHLMRSDATACDDQVGLAIDNFRQHLRAFHGKGIDGRPDTICVVIGDIKNQGRGDDSAIAKCLMDGAKKVANGEAMQRMLKIGSRTYADRIEALKLQIGKRAGSSGPLGAKVYDEATAGFRAPR